MSPCWDHSSLFRITMVAQEGLEPPNLTVMIRLLCRLSYRAKVEDARRLELLTFPWRGDVLLETELCAQNVVELTRIERATFRMPF